MSMSKITHCVIHYSASYEDQNLTVRDIDAMHKARGWRGVGYHYVIRRDGKVEHGRPESQVGAHVGGQNSGKIGICWIGGLNRATGASKGVDNRTDAQTESLITLIRDILKRHPGAKIVGHRDLAATQCPAFDVPAWWARVQKKKAPAPTPVPADAPVKTPGVAEDKPAQRDPPPQATKPMPPPEAPPTGKRDGRGGLVGFIIFLILAAGAGLAAYFGG